MNPAVLFIDEPVMTRRPTGAKNKRALGTELRAGRDALCETHDNGVVFSPRSLA
jgi:hypothetical protein